MGARAFGVEAPQPNPGRAAAGDTDASLAALRQEAATLRGALAVIEAALAAATERLVALEACLGASARQASARRAGAVAPPRPRGAGHSVAGGSEDGDRRTLTQWKVPAWAPPGREDVVTSETLRARREALGISQASVAHAAHCSRGLVAEVERGKRRSAQTLSHLAAVLDRLEQQARSN